MSPCVRRMAGILAVLLIWQAFGESTALAANAPIYEDLSAVNAAASASDWEQAAKEADRFADHYQKRRWWLQLIGDEQEYEGINRNLHKLHAAIQAKDISQTRLIVAEIRGYLEDIYSL